MSHDAVENDTWVECRCGKVRENAPDPMLQVVKGMSLCDSCAADFMKSADMCPEMVTIPNGVSACQREWAHRAVLTLMTWPALAGYQQARIVTVPS